MDYQKYITTEFDELLAKVSGIKWLPWVGKYYSKTKIMVLGESQYEDGDYWQENIIEATRLLIGSGFTGNKGKIYKNTEKVLLSIGEPTKEQGNNVWKSVVYLNLVQRLMSSIKERPNDSDFDKGWATFLEIAELLKPDICIVLGKSSIGRLGYYLNNNAAEWDRNASEFYEKNKIINLSKKGYNFKLIFINHPSGSYGFEYEKWAKLVKDSEPTLTQKLGKVSDSNI